jgi:hypothetical protein
MDPMPPGDINDLISRLLTESRFDLHSNERWWRTRDEQTDVVQLQMVSPAEADALQIPLGGFRILYGIYAHFIPAYTDRQNLYVVDDHLSPDQLYCHLRAELEPGPRSGRASGGQVWFVEWGDGDATSELVDGVRNKMLPFFDYCSEVVSIFDILASTSRRFPKLEIGNPGSPMRNYLLGFTAIRIGRNDEAARALRAAKAELDRMVKLGGVDHAAFDTPLFRQKTIVDEALANLCP